MKTHCAENGHTQKQINTNRAKSRAQCPGALKKSCLARLVHYVSIENQQSAAVQRAARAGPACLRCWLQLRPTFFSVPRSRPLSRRRPSLQFPNPQAQGGSAFWADGDRSRPSICQNANRAQVTEKRRTLCLVQLSHQDVLGIATKLAMETRTPCPLKSAAQFFEQLPLRQAEFSARPFHSMHSLPWSADGINIAEFHAKP